MNTPTNTTPELFYFPLTKAEIEALLGLLDLGVRNGGLPVAASAAVITRRTSMAGPSRGTSTCETGSAARPSGSAGARTARPLIGTALIHRSAPMGGSSPSRRMTRRIPHNNKQKEKR